jgi:hypothetical protein
MSEIKYIPVAMIVHVITFFVRALRTNISLICIKLFQSTKLKKNRDSIASSVRVTSVSIMINVFRTR